MLIDDGKGLGLLDFQDALAGHPAYDLVSLLQDARRDVAPDIEAAMRTRYAQATGAGNDFAAAYAVLGAQRNAKILGIFTRLWKRDGKPRYAAMRSEEHTSELQSLMRISYAVFCLKKKKKHTRTNSHQQD